MGKPHTDETIDDVRQRLYQRDMVMHNIPKHGLTDRKEKVATDWRVPKEPAPKAVSDWREGATVSMETEPLPRESLSDGVIIKPKRRYRVLVLMFSAFMFVGAIIATTLFLYFGGNQISGSNIALSINGPETIGGGEKVPLQVQVMNDNSVPIESVTLILKYPEGTQSTTNPPRMLYEQRFPLENLSPGQSSKVDVDVSVYGETNTKKQIDATIEYRVEGSGGTFYKEALPYFFTITSAPLVLSVSNVKQVASGQTVAIELKVSSNASTPLQDILITASYPNKFLYQKAYPKPVFQNDVWQIKEIKPEDEVVITIEGIVEGFSADQFRVGFSAGKASSDNQYTVSTLLAEARADFTIEQPFIDVGLAVFNGTGQGKIIMVGNETELRIDIQNTLNSTVYDMRVEVVLEGNVPNGGSVRADGSQFDPRKQSTVWDVTTNESLRQVLPQDKRNFKLNVKPGPADTGAFYKAVANVFARRVSDPGAQEQLIGSAQLDVRHSAPTSIMSQLGRGTAGLTDKGPIPPLVDEITTYTPTIVVEAGANDLSDASVEFVLPGYVDWANEYKGVGTVSYNPISRSVTWNIGKLSKKARESLVFQIEMKPSYSLVGRTPNVINEQQFRATDSFSGERVQVNAGAINTELSTEMGFSPGNGIVED